MLRRRSLPAPTVIKIDVEGAELSVLRGFRETLRDHVRLVYVEVHPERIVEFGGTVREVRRFLRDAGFDVAEISHPRTHTFLRASKAR